MRLDTANRSFFSLLLLSLGPYLLLGVFACGALSLAVFELVARGPAAVAQPPAGWAAVAFLAVVAAGAVGGIRSLYQQSAATRRLAAFVRAERTTSPPQAGNAAARAHIRHLDVVGDDRPYAFTYGLLAPRVVVSTGLLEATSSAELDAVLAHERYHVTNLDPLKTVAARAVPAAFFFLPALAHLRQRYLTGRELAADRRALRKVGVKPIAAALYKTATSPTPLLLTSAAAIGGNELLEVRIAQLEAGREPATAAVPPRALAATAAGLTATAAGIAVTIAAAGETLVAHASPGAEILSGVACGALWLVGGLVAYRFTAGH